MQGSGRERKRPLERRETQEAAKSPGKRQKEPYPRRKWDSSVKSKAIMMQPKSLH